MSRRRWCSLGPAQRPGRSPERGADPHEPKLEISCPRPGLIETEHEASSSSDEERGDVQDAIAERLRLGLRERTVETDELGPGEERAGDEGDLQPRRIAHDVLEGKVLQSAGLPVPDPILDAGMSTVAELECRDLARSGVGDATGVAEALADVEQRELRTGVRTLAPTEQSGPLRPGGEVTQIGELGDPRAFANSSVELDRLCPLLLLGEEECTPHLGIDRKPDRELAVPLDKATDEVVRRARRVRAHEDRVQNLFGKIAGLMARLVLGWERSDRLVQQLEVVSRVVRPGVSRTQHRRERLRGGVAPHAEGVETEALLVLCTWQVGCTGLSLSVIG